MAIEFVAEPGFAKMPEEMSIKLNLHMVAIGAILGNTLYVCRAYTQGREWYFPSVGNVKTCHSERISDIDVRIPDGRIKYQYDHRAHSVTSCTIYDNEGVATPPDVSAIQASYEALVDYAVAVMQERMSPPGPLEPV